MIFGPRVGHEALFDEICKSIELDRKLKTLLQNVIKQYQLPQPAKIFIEPEVLMRALNDPVFADDLTELQKLYDSWFTDQKGKR